MSIGLLKNFTYLKLNIVLVQSVFHFPPHNLSGFYLLTQKSFRLKGCCCAYIQSAYSLYHTCWSQCWLSWKKHAGEGFVKKAIGLIQTGTIRCFLLWELTETIKTNFIIWWTSLSGLTVDSLFALSWFRPAWIFFSGFRFSLQPFYLLGSKGCLSRRGTIFDCI